MIWDLDIPWGQALILSGMIWLATQLLRSGRLSAQLEERIAQLSRESARQDHQTMRVLERVERLTEIVYRIVYRAPQCQAKKSSGNQETSSPCSGAMAWDTPSAGEPSASSHHRD